MSINNREFMESKQRVYIIAKLENLKEHMFTHNQNGQRSQTEENILLRIKSLGNHN